MVASMIRSLIPARVNRPRRYRVVMISAPNDASDASVIEVDTEADIVRDSFNLATLTGAAACRAMLADLYPDYFWRIEVRDGHRWRKTTIGQSSAAPRYGVVPVAPFVSAAVDRRYGEQYLIASGDHLAMIALAARRNAEALEVGTAASREVLS